MSTPFIDVHSYQEHQSRGTITMLGMDHQVDTFPTIPFHFGIHPWQANMDLLAPLRENLKQAVALKNFTSLGECGLDKINGPEWSIQSEVFEAQIQLAIELEIPVLIIHCVKAYQETLNTVERLKFAGKIVFHDFNASYEIAKNLLQKGHYLSLGKTLDRSNSKVQTYLNADMLNSLLLESDDEEISIEKRYQQLESLVGCEVKERIYQNALRLWPQLKN